MLNRRPGEVFVEDGKALCGELTSADSPTATCSSPIYDGFNVIGQLDDPLQGVNVRNSCGEAT